jgi:hypothetical protein
MDWHDWLFLGLFALWVIDRWILKRHIKLLENAHG